MTIAFILLSLVLILKIDVIIPILLFVVAFIMFLMIKRMPTDEQRKQDMETHEQAFFDTEEALASEDQNNKSKEKKKKHR